MGSARAAARRPRRTGDHPPRRLLRGRAGQRARTVRSGSPHPGLPHAVPYRPGRHGHRPRRARVRVAPARGGPSAGRHHPDRRHPDRRRLERDARAHRSARESRSVRGRLPLEQLLRQRGHGAVGHGDRRRAGPTGRRPAAGDIEPTPRVDRRIPAGPGAPRGAGLRNAGPRRAVSPTRAVTGRDRTPVAEPAPLPERLPLPGGLAVAPASRRRTGTDAVAVVLVGATYRPGGHADQRCRRRGTRPPPGERSRPDRTVSDHPRRRRPSGRSRSASGPPRPPSPVGQEPRVRLGPRTSPIRREPGLRSARVSGLRRPAGRSAGNRGLRQQWRNPGLRRPREHLGVRPGRRRRPCPLGRHARQWLPTRGEHLALGARAEVSRTPRPRNRRRGGGCRWPGRLRRSSGAGVSRPAGSRVPSGRRLQPPAGEGRAGAEHLLHPGAGPPSAHGRNARPGWPGWPGLSWRRPRLPRRGYAGQRTRWSAYPHPSRGEPATWRWAGQPRRRGVRAAVVSLAGTRDGPEVHHGGRAHGRHRMVAVHQDAAPGRDREEFRRPAGHRLALAASTGHRSGRRAVSSAPRARRQHACGQARHRPA